ncbi:MAG TPA: hypothetical protein VGM30_14575 [Puia sp.]|jgi:hypothetical protein
MELINDKSYLSFDLRGGAITDFHLRGHRVNPLNFAYTREQMPVNNRQGAPFKGHFLCCGRWGHPSAQEAADGMPDHGTFSNMEWRGTRQGGQRLEMEATSGAEGLSIVKTLDLDLREPVFLVRDRIRNIGTRPESFHLVQHPTLSFPFLDDGTLINCNASIGFNQAHALQAEGHMSRWPLGYCEDGSVLGLRQSERPYNGLFSFLIDREKPIGWIAAYSPEYRLLFGYCWRREDYPWVHLWQHWEERRIKYRAMEFGVAGFHNAFGDLPAYPAEFMGERAYLHLGRGEETERSYICFLQALPGGCSGVADIKWDGSAIVILMDGQKETVRINTHFTNLF